MLLVAQKRLLCPRPSKTNTEPYADTPVTTHSTDTTTHSTNTTARSARAYVGNTSTHVCVYCAVCLRPTKLRLAFNNVVCSRCQNVRRSERAWLQFGRVNALRTRRHT